MVRFMIRLQTVHEIKKVRHETTGYRVLAKCKQLIKLMEVTAINMHKLTFCSHLPTTKRFVMADLPTPPIDVMR